MDNHTIFLFLTILLVSCGCVEEETDICRYRTDAVNASVEQMIDGELAASGDGMYVNTSSKQSYVFSGNNNTWGWAVQVQFDKENACRFGKIAQKNFYGLDDPRNRPVDTFINRPLNSTIMVSKPLLIRLYYASGDTLACAEEILWKDSALFFLEKRAKMPVIVYNPEDLLQTRSNLSRYREMGYLNVFITEDESRIPSEAEALATESGMRSERRNISGKDLSIWLKETTGLANSARINFETRGECTYMAQITGYADNENDAEERMSDIACPLPHKALDKNRIYR
jgi:hypothetical protein